MPDICKTDLRRIIDYLGDAAKLYDALATLPMQKCNSRAHMIRQLINKLKPRLNEPR